MFSRRYSWLSPHEQQTLLVFLKVKNVSIVKHHDSRSVKGKKCQTLSSLLYEFHILSKVATGGDSVKPKDSIMTRATTGKAKPVDYKQMAQGNYSGATWDGREFDSDRSNNDSDTGLYHDPDDVIRSEVDPFMGTGKPRGNHHYIYHGVIYIFSWRLKKKN